MSSPAKPAANGTAPSAGLVEAMFADLLSPKSKYCILPTAKATPDECAAAMPASPTSPSSPETPWDEVAAQASAAAAKAKAKVKAKVAVAGNPFDGAQVVVVKKPMMTLAMNFKVKQKRPILNSDG